jgi:hypothetical protein
MCKAAEQLLSSGFKHYPVSCEPPTYRSALSKSTIDFVFHRNVSFQEPEVSKVYIAQHRPISASVELPAHAISPPTELEAALGS